MSCSPWPGRVLVRGSERHEPCAVLSSDVPLSFWGGIDPETGVVIDALHPLRGACVAGSILCLPSGRGSCTGSQVMLELILNRKAPKALVLRDRDGLLCVGALVAKSVFPEAAVLDIVQVAEYAQLLRRDPRYGQVLADGCLVFGEDADSVREMAEAGPRPPPTDRSQSGVVPLTEEEQSMLHAAKTDAERRAAECIIHYAHIVSDSPAYIDVDNAHIDGCTYIGPGGLKFVQKLVEEGGQVRVPTTLNSVSTDLRHWERLGIPPTQSQQASIQLARSYLALGCSERSFTCAPYLLENPPRQGQQIVWGESNAVVYANSVLGARTEKYADYLDILCAMVGKVPAVGVHLGEGRQPQVLLDASGLDLSGGDPEAFSLLFPLLGHLCGALSDGEVPLLLGLEACAGRITPDHMKSFCAAFGTTGTSPLIHVAGVTPEAKAYQGMLRSCKRRRVVSAGELEDTFRILNQNEVPETKRIDLVALGNPHLSLSECELLAELVGSLPPPRRKHDDVQVIACMSRALHEQSPSVPALRDFGVEFVQDTCWCMLLEPPMIPPDVKATILTNSGKYAHYGPGLTGRKFRLGTMAECVQAAASGSLGRRPPSKFPWAGQSRSYSCQRPANWHGRLQSPLMSNGTPSAFPKKRLCTTHPSRFVLRILSHVRW